MASFEQTHKEFLDYCMKFYGKGGLYADDVGVFSRKEVVQALKKHVKAAKDFAGDTVDREAVRDIVLTEREAEVSTVYRTSDGEVFDTKSDADNHATKLRVREKLAEIICTFPNVDSTDIADQIIADAATIKKLLAKIK